jgi:dTDP-4-amino-4,6-dideoxy-D-glucose acyltransferase
VAIDPAARIIGGDRITIGSHVRIDAFAVLSAGEEGIVIGDYVHIAAHAFMAGAARIEIGDFVNLSGRTSIYSSNDDYSGGSLAGPMVPVRLRDVHVARVRVGRHAIIGAGSVILPGVTIGEGAAVGALSLVKQDVAEFAVVAGVPARRIGSRSRELLNLEARMESDPGEQSAR